MPALVVIPDASFFVKAQQSGDFHEVLSAPGLRLRVLVARPVYWELDNLRLKADLGYTVREVRLRLEQLLREQQAGQKLVVYETDLDTRTRRDLSLDEQLVAYLVQRARSHPDERIALISDNIDLRNLALLSPAVQQVPNVYVTGRDDWLQAADWLIAQSGAGQVQGWVLEVTPGALEQVEGRSLQGLRIHLACDLVDYSQGHATVMIWLQDGETGAWLEDRNGQCQTGGYVALSHRVPVYSDRQPYENTFFLPYDELHLAPGTFQLAIAANVLNPRDGRQVGESAWFEVAYTERRPAATIHEVAIQPAHWADSAGLRQTGLEVSCSFTVDSWRGRLGLIQADFRSSREGDHESADEALGRVHVSDAFVAHQEHAHFRHFALYIPYRDLRPDAQPSWPNECQVTLWSTASPAKMAESGWVSFDPGAPA